MKTGSVNQGETLTWACVATSDNPVWNAARFRTSLVTGTVDVPIFVPDAENYILSSVFTAFVMLLAAFYY